MATARFSMRKQTKSISLPSRSHPTTIEIEEQLNEIKIVVGEATSPEAICRCLLELSRLYKCMDDLLTSSTTQVLMSREQNKKWVDELVDESVNFLDICGRFGEMMSGMKDECRDLLCALRRRKGDSNVENSIMKYICFRKKMKKDVKVLVGSLKQVDNMIVGGGSVVVDSDNYQLVALIKAVIGVSEITVSVFESLLTFLSVPVMKQNRWSLVVSKLRHKRTVQACEDAQEKVIANEFESIDDALRILCKTGLSSEVGNLHVAECRLERLCDCIEWMESELECMFRCLVRTRVTLLNIISM